MAEVSLKTVRWAPGSAHMVTIRSSATEPAWTDVIGVYAAGRWRFTVPDGRQDLKFVLDGELWETGPNRDVDASQIFEEAQVAFPRPRIVTESGRLAAELVPTTQGHRPRVVVIGSGMGGGVLADELSDLGIDVLILEAGSYLLPCHAGNIPRRHRIGAFSKHIWELFEVLKSINYTNDPASQYFGGQSYNLGGRSIFWGGLIPRMGRWELSTWPAAVRDDLGAGRYTQAEDLMNATAPQTERQDDVLTELQQRLPDHRHRNAPVAVQYRGARGLAVPAGLFSTADLMLESLQVVGPDERKLRVNLHHEVLRLETTGDRVTRVHYRDHLARVEGAIEADVVVLAAGTVESATLALRSGLADPSGLVGVGMTDHPIYFTHFALPSASPFAGGSAKTWTWPLDAGSTSGQYNLVLEIGSDFNQNRFVDDDTLRRHEELRGGVGLGEVVALFNTPLVEENWLRLDDAGRPVIRMVSAPVAPEAMARAQVNATEVLKMVGAEALPDKELDLQPALLGGVAHEVGTLRMGGDGAPDGVVTSDLQYRGYDNLYVCDLSVFPSSPAANPSLTLVALAHRLARHLAGVLA
ncbi:GMC oxidoreductase [Geodermatophilus sp. SYSU D00779]